MRVPRRYWIVAGIVIGIALGVYFEPTYCVRGWLFGEAFFDGRPTSYWADVVERDLHINVHAGNPEPPPALPLWQRCSVWIGIEPHRDSSFYLLQANAAEDVLRDLATCNYPNVAGFARDALTERHERGDEVIGWWKWLELIDRHHLHGRASDYATPSALTIPIE